jgi:cell division septal protein FtsQ
MSRKKSILKTQTLVRRKRRLFWVKTTLYCLLGVLAVAGIVYLFHIQKFSITHVSIQGAVVVPEADIKSYAEERISGSYLYVFPKRSVAFYPKSGITKELLATYPRISELNLSLHSWNTLQLSIAERQSYAIWCKEEPLVREGSFGEPTIPGDCYFMDATGFIFDHAPGFSGDTWSDIYTTDFIYGHRAIYGFA